MPQANCNLEKQKVQELLREFGELTHGNVFHDICNLMNQFDQTGDESYKNQAISQLMTFPICNTVAKAEELLKIAFPTIPT